MIGSSINGSATILTIVCHETLSEFSLSSDPTISLALDHPYRYARFRNRTAQVDSNPEARISKEINFKALMES
jgi:hypothetical protein